MRRRLLKARVAYSERHDLHRKVRKVMAEMAKQGEPVTEVNHGFLSFVNASDLKAICSIDPENTVIYPATDDSGKPVLFINIVSPKTQ